MVSLGSTGGHLIRHSGHLAKCGDEGCCAKTITSFTISGATGCCADANGTYTVDADCTEDAYNILIASEDDGCDGCAGSAAAGPPTSNYRFTTMSLDVSAQINPVSGFVICRVTVNWEVYSINPSTLECTYEGTSSLPLRFTRATCDSGALTPPSPGIVGGPQPGNCIGSLSGTVTVV